MVLCGSLKHAVGAGFSVNAFGAGLPQTRGAHKLFPFFGFLICRFSFLGKKFLTEGGYGLRSSTVEMKNDTFESLSVLSTGHCAKQPSLHGL